ncbi:MAG: low molecular weight phosphotyrosine protein phosphatase [Micrococcales bacterium]|nr:low molecular weight phosphotyrosine protein phosphatase [Micrococcales bacterium]
MMVCTGNICRSAMAEVVLRDRLDAAGLGEQVTVCSRGVSDEEDGNPIDRRARTVLKAHDYPGGDDHVARQVTAAELRDCDLVLAMTASHAQTVRRVARGTDVPVMMYRSFDPSAPQTSDERRLDIADPWYGGPRDFETCLTQLEAAADHIVAHLASLIGEP